jgi:hypothetical protein
MSCQSFWVSTCNYPRQWGASRSARAADLRYRRRRRRLSINEPTRRVAIQCAPAPLLRCKRASKRPQATASAVLDVCEIPRQLIGVQIAAFDKVRRMAPPCRKTASSVALPPAMSQPAPAQAQNRAALAAPMVHVGGEGLPSSKVALPRHWPPSDPGKQPSMCELGWGAAPTMAPP